MKIKRITLHLIKMNLVSPFSTSLGTVTERESILIEAEDSNGMTGWGEAVAFSTPWYTEETVKTCWHILEDLLIPSVLGKTLSHPEELQPIFAKLKRNNMAKAGLEGAVWDLYAKNLNQSLSASIGGSRESIEAGVVVGIDDPDALIGKISAYLEEGYKRVKIKIKPGHDYDLLEKIRNHFPDLPLMADANSAYTLEDIPRLKALDEFKLMMIEQPLASDDIIDHAILQSELETPICLDESIISYEDARKAIQLGSCRVINIKLGRVGGILEAIKIHDLCRGKGIPVWCGGMLETGISRAHNIAIASLPQFTIPGDISSSSRYWKEDVILPEVKVESGRIKVPAGPGIGFDINREVLKKHTLASKMRQ